MAYSQEDKNLILTTIFDKIECGVSTRKAVIEAKISSHTFWKWIDESQEISKQYARACEARADFMADEILEIADSQEGDLYVDDNGETKIDGNTVQRARTQIDARKWLMSKLQPKKYGDKMQVAGDPENPLSVKMGFASEKQEKEFNEFLKNKYKFK